MAVMRRRAVFVALGAAALAGVIGAARFERSAIGDLTRAKWFGAISSAAGAAAPTETAWALEPGWRVDANWAETAAEGAPLLWGIRMKIRFRADGSYEAVHRRSIVGGGAPISAEASGERWLFTTELGRYVRAGDALALNPTRRRNALLGAGGVAVYGADLGPLVPRRYRIVARANWLLLVGPCPPFYAVAECGGADGGAPRIVASPFVQPTD